MKASEPSAAGCDAAYETASPNLSFCHTFSGASGPATIGRSDTIFAESQESERRGLGPAIVAGLGDCVEPAELYRHMRMSMHGNAGSVNDSDYPAIYLAADAASLNGQFRFFIALRLKLGGLVVAAVGGAFIWTTGGIDVWGAVAGLALLTTLGAESYTLAAKPDRVWYEGRAVAESAKSLAWRYMVGGDPFSRADGVASGETDELLLRELGALYANMELLESPPRTEATHQITATMRGYRQLGLADRRDLYDRERVESQRLWYAKKATRNSDRSRRYQLVTIVLELLGVLFAVTKTFGIGSIGVLGIVGAVGAGLAAWSQAKQYRALSSAYSVAAQELADIRSRISAVNEEWQWSTFVDSSEEAISREHTLWRTSRGVQDR